MQTPYGDVFLPQREDLFWSTVYDPDVEVSGGFQIKRNIYTPPLLESVQILPDGAGGLGEVVGHL